MPTTIADTDAFPSPIPRPSNGELADSASLAQFADALAKRSRYLYNRTRTRIYDVTRSPYNCDPIGATDSYAGLVAALSDAATAGGGDVLLPGIFKHSAALPMSPLVNLRGIPGLTILRLSSATDNQLSFGSSAGANLGNKVRISDIRFDASVVAAGAALSNGATFSWDVLLENCAWNDAGSSGNLSGLLFNGLGPSRFDFDDCNLHVLGTGQGLSLGVTGAELNIIGGRVVCPATYANTLVYYALGGGNIRTKFDFSAHSSGIGPTAVGVSSGPSDPVVIKGSTFKSAGSGPTKFALNADSGTNVVMTGNAYYGVNRFNSVGSLSVGSRLDLLPVTTAGLVGSSYTVSTGVESQVIRFDALSTNPTITMPPILFPGQELMIEIYNNSGAPFTGISYTGGLPSGAAGVANGGVQVTTWRAVDWSVSGTYSWLQISLR